jgi:hypothetical protein
VVRVGARVLNLLLIGQNKIFSNQLALKNADIVDEFISRNEDPNRDRAGGALPRPLEISPAIAAR